MLLDHEDQLLPGELVHERLDVASRIRNVDVISRPQGQRHVTDAGLSFDQTQDEGTRLIEVVVRTGVEVDDDRLRLNGLVKHPGASYAESLLPDRHSARRVLRLAHGRKY